eukprot:1098346-Amphidinium_carterae.1
MVSAIGRSGCFICKGFLWKQLVPRCRLGLVKSSSSTSVVGPSEALRLAMHKQHAAQEFSSNFQQS